MKIKTQKVIEVQDWDNLVKKTYNRPYSFQQQDGCQSREQVHINVPEDYTEDEYMNDSIPDDKVNGEEMGVKFATWLARDPKQELTIDKDSWSIKMFWERNFYPDLNTVINDLHSKGFLEAGEYVININW